MALDGGLNQQMQTMQESLKHEQKKMTGGLANRRQQLLGDIQGERQDYEQDLWSAYGTWLGQDPEQIDEYASADSSDCLANGGYISNGVCIMPGESQNNVSYEEEFEDWMQP